MGKSSIQGLTSEQVQERIQAGKVNIDAGVKTRSIKQIVIENICTLFNAINFILAIFVLITGSFKNMLFMIVIVCNTVIGIIQEIRSKITTDKLSVIASSGVEVIRDDKSFEIPLDQIVLDDIIVLGRGDQIPSDSVVVSGTCDVNESLLTGESKLIHKAEGDELMSGSFVNSGKVYARVVHVGADNYAAKITNEAKEHKEINSEIMRSLNGIIKFVSIIIFPLGAILFSREFFFSHTAFDSSILSTVSALIGMIPEGLILLTSTVLAVAVVRLAKYKVLVQQLYCIETLARVDVLCLDKTGTITTGGMAVREVVAIGGSDLHEAQVAFASVAASDEDPNETANAIKDYFGIGEGSSSESPVKIDPLKPTRAIPFSSDKKWSGATFANGQSYVMGASQFILGSAFDQVKEQQEELSEDARVLLVAKVDGFTEDGDISGTPVPLGFIAIHDVIRPTAKQTIHYFIEQGVTLKVISGDDPRTVSGIAEKVGIPDASKYIDATTLKTESDIADAIEKYAVFGRVKPEQKKAFVLALQADGHTVAMTGDGVNDTLALKAADCSVAMASGSDAARNVAQLVLVDNDFAAMPHVVAEGRRSINNLQRSASLFLVKTLLSMCLGFLFMFLPWQYPFQPIQMTLVSAFTIGIPSFVLALEPNHDLIRGHFLENVIVRSIPGALCAVLAIIAANIFGYLSFGLDYAQVSTMCVLLLAFVGVMLVIRLSIPYTPIRAALLVVIVAGLTGCCLILPNLFNIVPFTQKMWVFYLISVVIIAVLFNVLYNVFGKIHEKRLAR